MNCLHFDRRALTKGQRKTVMRHAYLIIAHTEWKQLKKLIALLDHPANDIYIHIDGKSKHVPVDEFRNSAKKSNIEIYQRYKVYWGSYKMVETELFLFERAHMKKYDYYHLLSGTDLPIKTQDEIHDFFRCNAGREFVHFDLEERLKKDHEIGRRTRLYHFLQDYRRRYRFEPLNCFFTLLERISLVVQIGLGIDRNKRHERFEIRYGSQWMSITDELVSYILENRTLIREVFSFTNCADELFVQSLIHNSDFRKKLYHLEYDNSCESNMRLIDWKRGKNGSPYVFLTSDYGQLKESECLFARKFSMKADSRIVYKVIALAENGEDQNENGNDNLSCAE